MMFLIGYNDSQDIPMNVSLSYLQADGAVKKISQYISRKVADKMNSLLKDDRESFEKKWNDIKVVLEYGVVSEEKFAERSEKFMLYKTVTYEYFNCDDLTNRNKVNMSKYDGDT